MLLTLAMVLFTPNSLKAQKQKYPAAKSLLRKEFHPEEGFVNLRAIQLGKEGVLLTSETYKIEKGESRFHYDIVNTDLQIVKENVLSVDRMVIGTGMTQKAFLGKVNYHHLFYGRKNFILHTIPDLDWKKAQLWRDHSLLKVLSSLFRLYPIRWSSF